MASGGRKTIDTSPQYIKMCKAAHEIQEEKWQKGYYEGDYIYIPSCDEIHVVGHDFLAVNQLAKSIGDTIKIPVFMRTKEPLTYENKSDRIEICYGKMQYLVVSYCNVVWLPTLAQLIDLILESDVDLERKVFYPDMLSCFLEKFTRYVEKHRYFSLERAALSYLMNVRYGKPYFDCDREQWIGYDC